MKVESGSSSGAPRRPGYTGLRTPGAPRRLGYTGLRAAGPHRGPKKRATPRAKLNRGARVHSAQVSGVRALINPG